MKTTTKTENVIATFYASALFAGLNAFQKLLVRRFVWDMTAGDEIGSGEITEYQIILYINSIAISRKPFVISGSMVWGF